MKKWKYFTRYYAQCTVTSNVCYRREIEKIRYEKNWPNHDHCSTTKHVTMTSSYTNVLPKVTKWFFKISPYNVQSYGLVKNIKKQKLLAAQVLMEDEK